jgi:tape measure domain-containing protein
MANTTSSVKIVIAGENRASKAFKSVQDDVRRTTQSTSAISQKFANMSKSQSRFTSAIGKSMQGVQKSTEKAGRAVSSLGNSFKSAGSKASGAIGGVEGLKRGILGVSVAAGAAASAIGALGLQYSMLKDRNMVAIESLTGSRKEAEKTWKMFTTFAKSSPFDTKSVAQWGKSFLAAGVPVSQLNKELTVFGNNVSAYGLDLEQANRAQYGYQQILSKGVAYTEDLNQLQESGIPIYNLLAEARGKSVAEIKKEASEGKITGKVVQQTLANNQKAIGAMEKRSKTLEGVWNSIKEGFETTVGEFVNKHSSKMIAALNWIQDALQKLGAFSKTVFGGFRRAWEDISKSFTPTQLKTLAIAVGALGVALVVAFSPVTAIGAAIAALVVGFGYFYQKSEGFRTVVGYIVGALKSWADYANWMWTNVWRPFFGWIFETVPKVGQAFVSAWNGIKTAWNTVSSVISFTWNSILKPIFTALWNTIGWVYSKFQLAAGIITTAFRVIQLGLTMAWRAIYSVVFQPIVAFLSQRLTPAFIAVRNTVSGVWGSMRATLSSGWNWIRNNVFNPMTNFVSQTIPQAFNNAVGWIRTAWDKIRGFMMTPVRFVVKTVLQDGLFSVWNKVAGLVGGTKLTVDERVERSLRLATGGFVRGPGTGTSDSIPAWLSNGEYVIKKSAVDNIGVQNLNYLNETGQIPAFANGGVVGGLLEIMKRSGIRGYTVNSTYRPGANDYHGSGQAVDFGGGGNPTIRKQVAQFWYQYSSHLRELIHSTQAGPPYNGYYVKNGKRNNNIYGWGTKAAHWNHVHVAATMEGVRAILGGAASEGGGGFLGSILDTFKSRFGNTIGKTIGGLLGKMPGGSTPFGATLGNIVKKAMSGLISFGNGRAKAKDAESYGTDSLSTSGDKVNGNLSSWIMQAIAATGVPRSWYGGPGKIGLYTMAMRESGGNPRAINNWDSNAKKGQASRGVMQTIPSTFAAYRLPSLPNDIYNPVANIAAAIRYIQYRYGSPFNLAQANPNKAPRGYWTGGVIRNGETGLVGEKGPELITAGRSSRIYPNSALSGNGSTTVINEVNININGYGGDARELSIMVRDEIARLDKKNGR